jgi:hypothetical protein
VEQALAQAEQQRQLEITQGVLPMCVKVGSTNANVRDLQKVREILDSYWLVNVEIELRQEGSEWFLQMAHVDMNDDCWDLPLAFRREDLPDLAGDPDEDPLNVARATRFFEKGGAGFLDLLRELAKHIASPLMILWAALTMKDGPACSVQFWRVQPGADEVETFNTSV